MKKTFAESCYEILRKVPAGKITTYKAIAKALKSRAYRAVGTAMKNNPHGAWGQVGVSKPVRHSLIPCHRVTKSNGEIGYYSKGKSAKIKLLKSEGIPIINNKIPNFQNYLYKF